MEPQESNNNGEIILPPISGEGSSTPVPEISYDNNIGNQSGTEFGSLFSMLGIALIGGVILTAYKYYKNS